MLVNVQFIVLQLQLIVISLHLKVRFEKQIFFWHEIKPAELLTPEDLDHYIIALGFTKGFKLVLKNISVILTCLPLACVLQAS